MSKPRSAQSYARQLVNRIMAPLNATLRKLEKLGHGDHPKARDLRAQIAAVKARIKDRK